MKIITKPATFLGITSFALLLGSCASVKVKLHPELVAREGIESAQELEEDSGTAFPLLTGFAQATESLLEKAVKLESKGATKDAAGDYLKVAVDAYDLLGSPGVAPGSETEKSLLAIHNRALVKFGELWVKDPRRLEPGPYVLASGTENLQIELSPTSTYHRGYFDKFIAADSVEEKGVVRKTREGIGATVVAIREQRPERADEMKFYPLRGLHLPVTLTMDSVTRSKAAGGATSVKFSLRNPQLEQSLTKNGRKFPVAANFSAPMAVILQGRNEVLWGLEGFFKAEERAKQSGIYLLEPYDPKRIPVLLIHGLISVPTIWRDIVPDMVSDPEIARRYQFMVFAYPSSFPILESAEVLRDNLAALRAKYDPDGNDPLSTNMVVAGHSMGGMLTHTLVAEMGDNLWKQFSDVPFDQVPLDPAKKEAVRKRLFFKPDPAVRRAVYFSAPHRGAKLAEKGISGWLSSLARLPLAVLKETSEFLDPRVSKDLKLKISPDKSYTSVQSLEPGAPMVAAMDLSPYKKGVIYHSVIGDRGRGDTPNSSDGFVEYWSSHQPGAASELIVPTDHGSYKHPKAIEELRRILREHAGIR